MRVASFSAIVATACFAAFAAGDSASDSVDRIIARLGSDTFRDREAATRELNGLGAAALDALRRAAAGSTDPETRRRAADLIERINERLTAARLLASTSIDFDYKNTPLDEAVRDLVRRSGGADVARRPASITLHDQAPTKFHGRRVTVATPGPMPFWEALELFCRKADLHEWDGFSRVAGLGNVQQAGEVFGGQIQGQVIVRSGRGRNPVPTPTTIVLLDGPGSTLPTCRNGAVRVRVLPPNIHIDGLQQTAAGEVVLPLHVFAEPKLQWQGVAEVRIDRAVDEHGQSLAASAAIRESSTDEDDVLIFNPINGMIVQNSGRRSPVGVRIQRGDKQSTRLAELAGSVTAHVRVAEALVVAESPLKLAGQTIRGAAGVSLKVKSAGRADNGEYNVCVELQIPHDVYMVGQGGNGAAMMVGGAMMLQGGVVVRQGSQVPALPAGTTDFQGLALEDAKGRRLPVTRGAIEVTRFNAPEDIVYQFTVTFKPTEAAQEPARIVFTGARPASVDVPFVVKDVPLQ
jgi:hypothetical protein